MPTNYSDTVTRSLIDWTLTHGVAGQYAYRVAVLYSFPDADPQTVRATFIGSVDGAPVVMVTDTFGQMFVDDWTRFGDTLNVEWLRKFFDA